MALATSVLRPAAVKNPTLAGRFGMCWRRLELLELQEQQVPRDQPDKPVRLAPPDPKEQRERLVRRDRLAQPEPRDRRGRPELPDPRVLRARLGQLVRRD